MFPDLHRRDLLRASLVAVAGPLPRVFAYQSQPEEVRAFRLVESAGLKRFSYPVHSVVPGAGHGRNFRLTRDGRAIPAQFRTVVGLDGKSDIALDFNASMDALETGRYEVHFGPMVEPGLEPKDGLKVENQGGRYQVTQGTMVYEFDHDLDGLLQSAGSSRLEYVSPLAVGLILKKKGEETARPLFGKGTIGSSITREGPLAVGLRFASGRTTKELTTVDLTIPSSKSWVQASVTVHDPRNEVQSIGLAVNLKLEGSPILVDFGASSTIYGRLAENQRMELIAGRAAGEKTPFQSMLGWVVLQGSEDKPSLLASSTPENRRPAEGWAHVMDAKRCTAFAVEGFGARNARDRIDVQANRRLLFAREYTEGDATPPPGPKTLRFWLHFVPMPVQVGAATSPQAILSPLRVDWDRQV